MRILIIFLSLLLFTGSTYSQLWIVDPLEALYPDSNNVNIFSNHWEADFPVGTNADAHVLIKVPKGMEFKVSASLNNKKLPYSIWNKLIDVPVEQNTGLDSRTELFMNTKNPYVIRRAPFRIFEIIKPFVTETFESDDEYTALRLEIPSSLISKPGEYSVDINVKGKDFDESGRFTFTVHNFDLPGLIDSKFFYTNWFNLSRMEEKHIVERWSDPWFDMLDKYAELMAHGRQNSISIPGELFIIENNEIALDEDRILKFIDVFRSYGFKYFESPHLMYRGDNDDWGDPELKVYLTKKRYYKDEGFKDVGKLMNKIKEFTVRNNLTDNWLQHISDEPTSVNAKCYKDVVKHVKEIFPEIKIMEATNDRDSIAGAIDIWCPLINDFQENESFFREREKLGEKVLVYTCLIPGGQWLNRTLDMERLRQVYFGWGAAFYNTSGYLHWGLNQYYADPYKQSVIKHPSPIAGENNYLPAGDTHIIYPGKNGPLSSVRFEAHRIGYEDYEMLQKIKEINFDLYEKLVGGLFRSYTDYNLNLRTYRSTRKELLKDISKN